MSDVEIERQLRLPAPEEPAVLPALVLGIDTDERGHAGGFSAWGTDGGYAVVGRLDAIQSRAWWRSPRTVGEARSTLTLLAMAAVVVVAVIGISQPGRQSGATPPMLAPAPSEPSSTPTTTPRPDRSSTAQQGKLAAGPFEMPWPDGPAGASIRLTVPTGWAWIGTPPTTIYRDDGRFFGFPVDLAAHSVSRVVTSVCAADASLPEIGPTFKAVGPTVDDLMSAIANVVGTRWSDPTDVTIGGFPAKRLTTTYDAASCPGPTRRWIWSSDVTTFFVEDGVTSTVYVVDVNGHRLVLTTDVRGGSLADTAQVEAIVASIEIDGPTLAGSVTTAPSPSTASDLFPESIGPDGDLRIGRHQATVEGVPLTFSVSTRGWEPQLGFYISKSTVGSQGAEATVRWTTFPNGRKTDSCPGLLSVGPRPTAAQLATAVATSPGVDLVAGPSDVLVGGLAAKSVALTVRDDVGCDPGFFYTYEPLMGGALWTDTQPGDAIMVWIVDVDGTLVFIEAQHKDAGPAVEQEIREIVESVRFE